MTQQLLLIRGLPGSGKSTLANKLAKQHQWQHFEADHFFEDELGHYLFNPLQLKQAHQWCQTQTQRALADGHSVVVSNTFVERWEMSPYFKMAQHCKVNVLVIECEQNYGSIHDVPQQTIKKMHKNWHEISMANELQRYDLKVLTVISDADLTKLSAS